MRPDMASAYASLIANGKKMEIIEKSNRLLRCASAPQSPNPRNHGNLTTLIDVGDSRLKGFPMPSQSKDR